MRTTATTRYGQVEGTIEGGTVAFKGIPFSASTEGNKL